MKQSVQIVVLGILLANGGILFSQRKAFESHVTVLSSPGAAGNITKQRIASCLQQLSQEWGLDRNHLPNIVFIHASKEAAQAAHIKDKLAVRRNTGSLPGETYYEVWLVGEPRVPQYVFALENVLESHFQLPADEKKRLAVMSRVLQMQHATIDVAEGK